MREELLAEEKLTAIDQHQIGTMQVLVRRMAKRLANRYSRQQRRAKKGKLNVGRTLRKAMGHGGVPFDIVWKSQVRNRPKIVCICDVSGSVAAAAQFLLLFLYCLQEVVERMDAFAPDLILVSAGFDAHARDPLADQQLEAEDYAWATGAILAAAKGRARGRVVSSLEGGYDLEALGQSALAHVRALQGA